MRKDLGRPKKYSKKALDEKVEAYFKSISRERVLTEKRESGKKDEYGHKIYDEVPILNRLGEEVKVIEYFSPPTVGGLCEYLGIHRSTWNDYCNPNLYPDFADTTTRAQGRMRAWREEQVVTRKDVKGIIFDLENNYYGQKNEPGTSKTSAVSNIPLAKREDLLKEVFKELNETGKD